jgi:UDP-glucose:(heptosyl)LPS alpha-1,3-glucosyltransferase
MVVAEAMACGLPVVIGKDIGAAEWVRDGDNGFICRPEEVGKRLQEIQAHSNEVLERVRQRARATATLHTWDECAAQTMQVYQRAIAIKRRSK